MVRAHAQPQHALFDPPVQPRRGRRETVSFYHAVLLLRHAGHTVHRAGPHDNLVDGERVNSHSLVILARCLKPKRGKPRNGPKIMRQTDSRQMSLL